MQCQKVVLPANIKMLRLKRTLGCVQVRNFLLMQCQKVVLPVNIKMRKSKVETKKNVRICIGA